MSATWPESKRWDEGAVASMHDELNTYLRNAEEFLAVVPAARVGDATNPSVSLPDATWTQITGFDTERYDSDGLWSAGGTALTIQQPGIYLVTGHVAIAANTVGRRGLRLRHSTGFSIAEPLWEAPQSAIETPLTAATIYYFAAGESVQLWGYQDSGGALDIVGNQTYSPELTAMFVSGLGRGHDWTDPFTWTSSGDETDLMTTALLDFELGNNDFLYHRPAVRMRSANGAQSIPSGSGIETKLLLDSVDFDSWMMHDTSLGYSRFVAPCDGIYLAGTLVTGFSGGLGGARQALIKKTAVATGSVSTIGRDISPGRTNDATPKDLGSLHTTGLAQLAAGDSLHVTLTHDAGSAIDLVRNDRSSPVFWAVMIGGY